jgi:SSS family solute:Na+ symporter
MLLIGKLSPRDEAYEQLHTDQVDIEPFKYLKVAGGAICLTVIGIYIYFM